MLDQRVPTDLLQKANKILFITHLALGDFTYLQNYFSTFSKKYPHIKIHVWVDEVRKTRCFWQWKHLKNYSLYDWLAACPFIHRIYKQTYSPSLAKKSAKHAKTEQYPIIVSLATLRSAQYARLARSISSQAFVACLKGNEPWYNIRAWLAYRSVNTLIARQQPDMRGHITDTYHYWFSTLFGVTLTKAEQFPFVTIPTQWRLFAKLRFLKWGIDKKNKQFARIIFINPYAKTPKRSWPIERVVELIKAIMKYDAWGDVHFVINVMPENYEKVQKILSRHAVNNTVLFSAESNFFQLPAIMEQGDLVISVETSTMHLANAVHVPVIALMRQKNPEWAPFDSKNSVVITTKNRKEWVCDITVDQVLDVLLVEAERRHFLQACG